MKGVHMGLFSSRAERELDSIIMRIESNMANNYKDAAQENFRELEETFKEMCENGQLKEKKQKKYEDILETFRARLKSFTHKDQKPYWH